MRLQNKQLLGVGLHPSNKTQVLEKLEKYSFSMPTFCHVVSLNPEILVIAHKNEEFKEAVSKAQIQIVDGVGVAVAGRLLGLDLPSRTTGVDLAHDLLNEAGERSLAVMLIGGKGNLAENLAECYSRAYPEASYIGIEGVKNIENPSQKEEEAILSIITARRPRMILFAFGSPAQELWIHRHQARLKGIVCMGVGGAFDYLSGAVRRPNLIIRKSGFEWLSRLIKQPWRWRRQLRLIEFVFLVLRQKLFNS